MKLQHACKCLHSLHVAVVMLTSQGLAISMMLALVQDIDEAIHRLPQDVVDARMQRLKRAVDCSLKKSYLSKDIQDMQTPYAWYLQVLFLGSAVKTVIVYARVQQ